MFFTFYVTDCTGKKEIDHIYMYIYIYVYIYIYISGENDVETCIFHRNV